MNIQIPNTRITIPIIQIIVFGIKEILKYLAINKISGAAKIPKIITMTPRIAVVIP